MADVDAGTNAASIRLLALERRLTSAAATVAAELAALKAEVAGVCMLLSSGHPAGGHAPSTAALKLTPAVRPQFLRAVGDASEPELPDCSKLSRLCARAESPRDGDCASSCSEPEPDATPLAETGIDAVSERAATIRPSYTSVRDLAETRERRALFDDPSAIIEGMEKKCVEDPPVRGQSQYYHSNGICSRVVLSNRFQVLSFSMVCISSIWISVEIDADATGGTAVALEVVSQAFCVYFVLELLVQVFAFRNKRDIVKDKACMFDLVLVTSIVVENWVLAAARALAGLDTNGGGSSQILLVFRMLRLMKVLRLGRVMRQLPELMVIVKGIARALKAISVVIVLLALVIYMAGIGFRVLFEGTDLGEERFATVPMAMGTLLVEATLSGSRAGQVMREAHSENVLYAGLILIYVLLTNITIMGVLAGVLVQTVRTVTEIEKAEKDFLHVSDVMNRIWEICQRHDDDGDGCISLQEFIEMFNDPETADILIDVGTDLEGLAHCSESIFAQYGGKLTLPQFKRTVLNHRGKVVARIKDHVETRQFLHERLQATIHGSLTWMNPAPEAPKPKAFLEPLRLTALH